MMMMALFSTLWTAAAGTIDAASLAEPAIGYAETVFDFVEHFDEAEANRTLETSASAHQTSGGVTMPGIFQHPLDEEDARLVYSMTLPEVEDGDRLLLVFGLGLRDGVRFDEPGIEVDGVLCGIEVDGTRFFEAAIYETKWREYSVDLTAFAGKTIALAFTTNSNGTSNYDWLVWGNPRLVRLFVAEEGNRPTRITTGLVWAERFDGSGRLLPISLERSTPIDDLRAELLETAFDEEWARFGIFAFMPKVVVRHLASGSHLLFMGKDYEVRCTVENVGEAPVEDFHKIRIGISGAALRRGRADRNLTTLGVGETATLSWQMRGMPRRESVDVTVTLRSVAPQTVPETPFTETFTFHRAAPPLPSRTSNELRSVVQKDYALLENEFLRLAFIQENGRYPYFLLFAQKGGNLQQVATSSPISEVVYLDGEGAPQRLPFIPTIATMGGSNAGDASIHLTAHETDEDGVEWTFEAVFTLYDDTSRVLVDYRATPSAPRSVLHFAGPILRVGDGGPGARKEFALFPGLEMLEGDEVSSSTRDAAPPINNRFAPHPYKITIPAIAVQQGGVTTGVLWDPLRPWGDDDAFGLSAMFASPNWHDGENNHLLGVFLPTIPDYVPENALWAERPVDVGTDGIQLRAQIFADPRRTIFDVPDLWAEAYGFPKLLEQPRSDEEELFLSRYGFMVTTWDEETQKSRHCVDWAPANSPGFATLLWYDYLATGDEEVRERVELIARKTIEEQGPGGLASTANCHILQWEFPFYYGHVRAAMDAAHATVRSLIASQKEDGTWVFNPPDERRRSLGKPGDAVLGTSARNALTLLKFARITADQEALEAGLKALEAMNRYAIPRGAQGWECPLYEPDILAAAYAVGAYVEAYQITGDPAYRDRAEYWAKTGLSFLYWWNLPDRPGMRFGSIPVFGTTFYTHSWFGVPVQWNGLVYAYFIQRLSRYSDYPWSQIAEGITISAMYQQWTEGKLKGTYPDGFYEFSTEGRGPHLNPEDIMANLLALRGHDPDISTAIVRLDSGRRVHVSSGAAIMDLGASSDEIRFTLSGFPGHDSHVLVGNVPAVSLVLVDGQELQHVDAVDLAEPGWSYDPDRADVVLRIPQGSADVRVVLKLAEKKRGRRERAASDDADVPVEAAPAPERDDVDTEEE